MFLNLALLTGGTSATAGIMAFLPQILLFVALIYFMIIRPNKKRQQNAKDLMSSIQVGDKIQTIGGFVGEVLVMEEDEFVILSEDSKMRIKKNAVSIRVTAETVVDTEEKKEVTVDDDEDFKIEDFEI